MNKKITFDALSFSFVCKQILGTDNHVMADNIIMICQKGRCICISKHHQFQVMLPYNLYISDISAIIRKLEFTKSPDIYTMSQALYHEWTFWHFCITFTTMHQAFTLLSHGEKILENDPLP